VCERHFDDLARVRGAFGRPVGEARPEAVRCQIRALLRRSSISNTMLDNGSARRDPGKTGAAGSGMATATAL
jgi:hypothetical protein